MRVDEGRKGWSLQATKKKARAVVGRGEKSLLSDPGSELPLGKEKDKRGKYWRNKQKNKIRPARPKDSWFLRHDRPIDSSVEGRE